MGSSFGQLFRITTFGESHGGGVGVILDGCPPGLDLGEEDVQPELDRRRPGQSEVSTPRRESDTIQILSGVFDAYPDVKIILGHLGESLPFSLWRINQALSRQGNRDTSFSFRDYFRKHFWITTSGNFSNPALLCSVMEMGVDRILFSVDYPFVPNQLAADWIPTIPLCDEDKTKILSGNAERLLRV